MPFLAWLAALSAFTFIISLLLIPWLVGRLSADFFVRLAAKKKLRIQLSAWTLILALFRNCIGLILLFAGFIMLFLPGQGLLTILLGIILLSFPGKRKIIVSLISRPGVQRSLDWVRKKRKSPPFIWPRA